jgi:hypothetical protein
VDLEEENSSEEWSVKDKDVIPKEASIPESSAQVDIDGDNNPFAAAEEEDAGSVPKRQEDGDGDTTESPKPIQSIDDTKSTESESSVTLDLDNEEDGDVVTETAASRPSSSEESVADPPKAQVVDDAGEQDSNENQEAGTPQPQVDEVVKEDSSDTSTTTVGEESSSKSTLSELDTLDLNDEEEDGAVVTETTDPLSLEESETDTPESRVEDDSSSLDNDTTKNAKEAAP